MAKRAAERIANLVFALLTTIRYLSRTEIRNTVVGYGDMTEYAFNKAFERDRDAIANLGIVISEGLLADFDEKGYRIERSSFELPQLDLAPDELTVLAAASQVWRDDEVAQDATAALAKLRAADPALEPPAELSWAPTLDLDSSAFVVLRDAVNAQQAVKVDSHGSPRTVQPWELVYRRGVSYLLGFEPTSGIPKLYRLNRMSSTPATTGKPGAYEIPDEEVRGQAMVGLEPPAPDQEAIIAIRDDRAPWLNRTLPVHSKWNLPEGFTAWLVSYTTQRDFGAELASYGPDVIVLDPPELVTAVRSQLQAVAG
jgi:proteasome accessory factor B